MNRRPNYKTLLSYRFLAFSIIPGLRKSDHLDRHFRYLFRSACVSPSETFALNTRRRWTQPGHLRHSLAQCRPANSTVDHSTFRFIFLVLQFFPINSKNSVFFWNYEPCTASSRVRRPCRALERPNNISKHRRLCLWGPSASWRFGDVSSTAGEPFLWEPTPRVCGRSNDRRSAIFCVAD